MYYFILRDARPPSFLLCLSSFTILSPFPLLKKKAIDTCPPGAPLPAISETRLVHGCRAIRHGLGTDGVPFEGGKGELKWEMAISHFNSPSPSLSPEARSCTADEKHWSCPRGQIAVQIARVCYVFFISYGRVLSVCRFIYVCDFLQATWLTLPSSEWLPSSSSTL